MEIPIDNIFKEVTENNDQEAFRTLFFQFYSPLCVFANRYISDPMVCEDIVQETFSRIWEKRKQIFVTSSFRNFLVTMVRNGCIDYLRKQEQETNWVQWKLEVTSEETNGEIYTLQELQNLLEEALKKLPAPIRISFILNRFEGKKYIEIADAQHISVKTVEAHISKALKFLRTELKDYLPMLLFLLADYNQQ